MNTNLKGLILVKWTFKNTPAWKSRIYSNELNISAPLANTLINRNIKMADYKTLISVPEDFIEAPELLPHSEEVAAYLLSLIAKGYEFTVFSDYDVDGLTSGYIMMDYIKSLGVPAKLHYPEREDGYGINLKFCTEIVKKQKETRVKQVVITTDNGITANKEITFLKANHVEVIITDHHEPSKYIPKTLYCNPYADSNGHGLHLAGAAVAWKLCLLMDKLNNGAGKNPYEYLPYVAIGTIADVMPMTLENIALVKIGLDIINEEKPEPFKTIMELNKIYSLTSKDISWTIGPLLNAAGRMGDIWAAGKLFVTAPENRYNLEKTEDDDLSLQVTALMSLNEERKRKTDSVTKKALKNDYSKDNIIIYNNESSQEKGLAGIIANKLVDKFNKPVIVYSGSDTIVSGSARAPYGMDIFSLLEEEKQKKNISDYGGHIEAFGIKLVTNKIEAFKEELNLKIEKALNSGAIQIPEKSLEIDGEIYITDLSKKTYKEITSVPYDNNIFPEPKFVLKNIDVEIEHPYSNKEHLVMKCRDKDNNQITLVSWESKYSYSNYVKLGSPSKINIVGTISDVGFPDKTTGRRSSDVTFNIMDIRPASD